MRKDSPFFALVAAWWLIAVHLSLTAVVKAQSAAADPNNASISGQVTLGSKPARGIKVSLVPGPYGSPDIPGRQSVVTDEEGQYEFKELAAGRYGVLVASYVYVSSDIMNQPPSRFRLCTVAASESLKSVDIRLARGGVITGRITDATGNPAILETVQLTYVDETGKRHPYFSASSNVPFSTDDRGIYRIFSLLPGRYLVSAGQAPGTGGSGGTSGSYPRVYYPGVKDAAQAKVIEVREGGEVTGIDLRLGTREKTFAVSGHVVESTTGQPMIGAMIDFDAVDEQGRQAQSFGVGNALDERAGFRFNGLRPGRYRLRAVPGRPAGYYGEPVFFEIKDQNVDGLEVKMQPGANISGVVTFEGVNDPAAAFSEANLSVRPINLDPNTWRSESLPFSKVQLDGSFQLTGLPPSQVRLEIYDASHRFYLSRVEVNGAQVQDALEVKSGDQMTGVRLVLVPATGAVRGRVNVVGTVPDGWLFDVGLRPVGGGVQQEQIVALDAARNFIVQNLPPGDYEISVTLTPKNAGSNSPLEPTRQRVTVNEGATTETVITFNVR